MKEQIFKDRSEAGCLLADELANYRQQSPIILGLARGGMVLATEIARELDAELDVMVARKVGAPNQSELAIGAIAPYEVVLFNESLLNVLEIDAERLSELVAVEQHELERRINIYRGGRQMPDLQGRIVILVDDGIATGLTVRSTVSSLRKCQPAELIIAVPVSSRDAKEAIEPLVDHLVCLSIPEDFNAVGQWYGNFDQTSDEDVIRLMKVNS